MKTFFRFPLFVICFAFLVLYPGFTAYAQVSTQESPYTLRIKDSMGSKLHALKNIQRIQMPEVNSAELAEEDAKRDNKGGAFRFGISIPVNINMDNSGVWDTLSDGTRIWRLRIALSKEARSLSFVFNRFYLPEKAKFFVYSEDKIQVLGAFTAKNNQGGMDGEAGSFATSFIYGHKAVLEYMEPAGTSTKPVISLKEVVHAYRGIKIPEHLMQLNALSYPPYIGGSASCEVNINCPPGSKFQKEKRAVALITLGGFACTGSLVQNTARDGSPYFLTANHCLNNAYDANGNTNVASLVVYWNYESPDCSNSYSATPTTVGATLLANSQATDFALLKLTDNPSTVTGLNPYYLEWSRDSTAKSSGALIHHPMVDIKKISLDTSSLITPYSSPIAWYGNSQSFQNNTAANTHWSVLFDLGESEPGSSGSPLLDQNHMLIGQLHGGFASNCMPKTGLNFFGRFDLSWNGDGTPQRSLKPWLDPLGSNSITSFPISIKGPDSIFDHGVFVATGVNPGETVTWSYSPLDPDLKMDTAGNTVTVTCLSPESSFMNLMATLNGQTVSFPVKLVSGKLVGNFFNDNTDRVIDSINYIGIGNTYGFFDWPYTKDVKVTASGSGTNFNWYGDQNFNFDLNRGQSFSLNFRGFIKTGGKKAFQNITKKFIASSLVSIQVSPNPSSNQIHIEVTNITDTSGKLMKAQMAAAKSSGIYESRHSTKVFLYDLSTGILVRKWYFDDLGNNYNVYFSGLKPGNYVLKLSRENQLTTANILIL